MSHSTLQKRCDAVQVKPKESLDLLRFIRVIYHHAHEAWNLQRWLDVDDRTARALLDRAGFASGDPRAPSLETFLQLQCLIRDPELIDVLRVRLLRTFRR